MGRPKLGEVGRAEEGNDFPFYIDKSVGLDDLFSLFWINANSETVNVL